MENGHGARARRGVSERRARRAGSVSKEFRGRLRNPALSALLDEIWLHECSDAANLVRQCDRAVEMADCGHDEQDVFWARITRLLLVRRHGTTTQIADDLDAANTCVERVPGARARRLLRVGQAMLLQRRGEYLPAFEALSSLQPGSVGDIDDADDYFIHGGIAQCASKLNRFDAQFSALYANLRLTERVGPAVRHAVAANELAAALNAIGRPAEALKLLGGKTGKSIARFDNPLLLAHLRVHTAIAKYGLGRSIEAHNELVEIVHDGLTEQWPGLALLVHSSLTGVCLYRGLLDEADQAALQAYGVTGSRPTARLGICHQAAGILARARGNLPKAIERLEEALQCFEQDAPICTPMDTHIDAGEVLAQCYAAQGQVDLASAARRRFSLIVQRRAEAMTQAQSAAAAAQRLTAVAVTLSERELECISWSAAGKTAWETGRILRLSEWTVVYHLEKAKKKFGLSKKRDVVGRAISLGLIPPSGAQ